MNTKVLKVHIASLMLCLTLFCVPHIAAVEAVLMDFNRLKADIPTSDPEDNSATLLGFDDLFVTSVGVSLSESEKETIQFSLAIPEWTILLNSSARSPYNIRYSDVREAVAQPSSAQFAGESSLGVRLTFPIGDVNAWALIEPPYRVPRTPTSTLQDGREVNYDGLGRLRNVGQIRSISLDTYGLNYPHKVSLLIEGTDGLVREYRMGTLQFEGWNTLTWENPAYAESTPTATENGEESADQQTNQQVTARPTPLYPVNVPVIALRGIRIYKNALYPDRDFIGYFKTIRVDYDEAQLDSIGDIDNEEIWHILEEREDLLRQREFYRRGTQQFYESIQNRLRHKGE